MSICLMNISIVGIKYRQVKFEFNEEKRHEKWVQERTEAYQRLFISLINQGQTMLLNILFAQVPWISMFNMHAWQIFGVMCVVYFIPSGEVFGWKSKNNC